MHKLFGTWWERDAAKFRRYFTEPLTADGTPLEPKLAGELAAANSTNERAFSIFDEFFNDEGKLKRITLVLNTAAGVIVACSEGDQSSDMLPDCTGMPKLHLFLVTLYGLNLRSIAHLATTETVDADKVSVWTEGAV